MCNYECRYYLEYESDNVYDDNDDDDYYIFFVDPDYGYVENEEDCDEDYNLYDENE